MKQTEPVIHSDPEIMGGTPVFVGTRVPLATLLDYLEAGQPISEFLEDFPTVTREQAVAALEQARRRSSTVRVLLDECLPRRLKRELVGHDVRTAPEMGWPIKSKWRVACLGGCRVRRFPDQRSQPFAPAEPVSVRHRRNRLDRSEQPHRRSAPARASDHRGLCPGQGWNRRPRGNVMP